MKRLCTKEREVDLILAQLEPSRVEAIPVGKDKEKKIKRLKGLVEEFSNILKTHIPTLSEDLKTLFVDDSLQQAADEFQESSSRLAELADTLARILGKT